MKENFLNISSFGDSINFSVQIFTGLGYADIKPDLTKGSLGNTIVSIENIVGYIWISLTLVVIGRKILK
ncbi:ion channel [Algoriphagus boritolerans]|uniref:ion channel n=1 Tax=Algoriphagus boritolerans TaxID=308111 RepID=UPI003A0FF862